MQNEANSSSNTSQNAFVAGQKLAGCYVLNREIPGESGLAVWLANDEVLGKEVSLHFVPLAILDDQRGMAELRQEVKRNRQLIHPHILRVYDFVEGSGFAAVSMDRFDGESLESLLKRKGRFEPSEIKAWIQQLAGTLDDAHRVQLLHRDIAPSNIYVRPSGGLFVTNFGVARCIRDAMERTRSLSSDSLHMAYMSPQQVDGEKPTKSDDVYGLGVLVCELISGKLPFSGHDVVPAIRTTPAPRVADLLGAPVASEWESFVAACMSKAPEQRPATCGAAVALIHSSAGTAGVGPSTPMPEAPPVTKAEAEPVHSPAPPRPAAISAPGAPVKSGGAERRVSFGGNTAAHFNPAPVTEAPEFAAIKDTTLPPEPVVPDSNATTKAQQAPPAPPVAPANRQSGPKANLSSNFPELSRPKSKWPVVMAGLAVGLAAFAVINPSSAVRVKKINSGDTNDGAGNVAVVSPDVSGAVESLPLPKGDSQLPPLDGSLPPPVPEDVVNRNLPLPVENVAALPIPVSTLPSNPADISPITPPPSPPSDDPNKSAVMVPKPSKREIIGAKIPPKVEPEIPPQVPTSPPDVKVPAQLVVGVAVKLPPLPQMPAKLTIPPGADTATLEKLIAERSNVEVLLKQTAGEAEQAQQEILHLSDRAKKAQEDLRKTLDERKKVLTPMLKENDALVVERKKREEEASRSEALALEARKVADAAKTAYETLVQQAAVKLEAAKKADEELRELGQKIVEQAKQSEEFGKNQTQVLALRQQAALGLQQIERERALLIAAVEKAKAGALEAMRVQNQAKIADLQKKIAPLESDIKRCEDVLVRLKDIGEAGIPAAKPISERIAATNAQLKALRDEIAQLGGASSPVNAAQPVQPTLQPPPVPTPQPLPPKSAATTNGVNSIGMRFVKIDDVDFAVNLVTRKDYEAFANEKKLKGGSWRTPGFTQEEDHPVVNVTWKEADAFCKWLTEKDRKAGAIKPTEFYRLPSDFEWSRAVGLPPESGATPEDRDLGVDGIFPWGIDWPPPAGAGNYAGEETNSEVKLQGYRDDFQWTSPVGKFKPNAFGLNDMGGNVWQWTNDYFNEAKESRVLRGGSWYNGGIKPSLLASCRYNAKPDASNDTYGFRVVRASEGGKPAVKPK